MVCAQQPDDNAHIPLSTIKQYISDVLVAGSDLKLLQSLFETFSLTPAYKFKNIKMSD